MVKFYFYLLNLLEEEVKHQHQFLIKIFHPLLKEYHFQLNLMSLAGVYGEYQAKTAHDLLKSGFYDYVGSDLHRTELYDRALSHLYLTKTEEKALQRLFVNNGNLW